MMAINELKERFNSDPPPIRWGGIAADLLRLSNIAHSQKAFSPAFQDILLETKLFTEWLAPEAELKEQETILSLQRLLSKWSSSQTLNERQIEKEAREWSDKILGISGLNKE